MSSTRNSNQAIESKIDGVLDQVRHSKNTLEMINLLETLLADEDINEFISKPSQNNDHAKKLLSAYTIVTHTFVKELRQLGELLTSQLTELDNIKIDDMSPISHTNMANAFVNLSNYLVNEIINPDATAELRLIKLKRWINILRISLGDHDYHSAAAITAGLHNDALSQLQTTFSLLSDKDRETIEAGVSVFLKDQGWDKMQTCLSHDTPFVPNLGGIKKTITRAIEAKKTNEMEAALLKEKGQLTTSSNKPTEQSASASTKKDTLAQLEIIIAHLNRDRKKLTQFTPLQYGIIQADPADTAFRVKAIPLDDEEKRLLAIDLERRDIPALLNTLHAKLAKACTATLNKKHKKLLSDPLKPLKRYLKKIKLTDEQIITPGFTDTDQFKRLLKAFHAKEFDISVPAIHEINTLLKQIDSFTRRRARLTTPSSSQAASSRNTSTYSTSSTGTNTSSSTQNMSIFSNSTTSLSLSNTNLLTELGSQSAFSASISDTESNPDSTDKPKKHPVIKRALSTPAIIVNTPKENTKKLFKSRSLSKLSTFANPKQSRNDSAHQDSETRPLVSTSSDSSSSAAAAAPASVAPSAAKPTGTPRTSSSGLMSPRQSSSHEHPTARIKVLPKSTSSSRLMSPRQSISPSTPRSPAKNTKK